MRRLLRWLGIAVATVVLASAAGVVAARLHDGPIGPLTGGVFRAGEVTAPPADWSFAADTDTLELELPPELGRSITTWLVVQDGKLYVPCGVAAGKRWPHAVLRDGRVRVRLDGKIYELSARRVDDPATLSRVVPVLVAKYPAGDGSGFGTRDWLFALEPR
jgi:hypothetical protein